MAAVAEHLSRVLDLSVLMDDGSPLPNRVWLIRWEAAPRKVWIKDAEDNQINLDHGRA